MIGPSARRIKGASSTETGRSAKLPRDLLTSDKTLEEADINSRIWQVVAAVPEGKVCTYGDIAARAGLHGAARRIGRALKVLPGNSRIPWHRIIKASGRIAFPEGTEAHERHRERLEGEGVEFKPNGAIDLARFRW